MKIGVLLPTFEPTAYSALLAAAEAEAAGIHGVFVFDHLWQPGTVGRPALSPFPLLGAIVARTARVAIGTLVARVGLSADELLVSAFVTLDRLSGGRVIAGLGTGDAWSAPEHVAFGLPYPSAAERRQALARCTNALVDADVEVWIGGGGVATNAVARAAAVPVNLWSASPERVAEAAAVGPVTWGGVLRSGEEGALLRSLADAGASWAVFTWGEGLGPLLAAVHAAEVPLDA